MYSKFPQDIGSNDDTAVQVADDVACNVDNVLPIYTAKNAEGSHYCQKYTDNSAETYQGASLVQMAFLQLMTQKVMEAVANCPDALKLADSDCRPDQE